MWYPKSKVKQNITRRRQKSKNLTIHKCNKLFKTKTMQRYIYKIRSLVPLTLNLGINSLNSAPKQNNFLKLN